MKKNKSNLDEMQEQKLLRIEHFGCWIAFWGLCISILLQRVFGKGDFENLAGETCTLLVLSLYIYVACLKNGIWDRKLKPNMRTNLAISLLSGMVMGAVWFASSYYNYHKLMGSIATGMVMLMSTSVLCFVMLQITTKAYRKRKAKLEQETEEQDNE